MGDGSYTLSDIRVVLLLSALPLFCYSRAPPIVRIGKSASFVFVLCKQRSGHYFLFREFLREVSIWHTSISQTVLMRDDHNNILAREFLQPIPYEALRTSALNH